MWPFTRSKTAKEPEEGPVRRYGVGWACFRYHVQMSENDGVCCRCSNPVKRAVAIQGYIGRPGPGWVVLGDGFLRWLDGGPPEEAPVDSPLPAPPEEAFR